MKFTTLFCGIILILAVALVIWQAKVLAKCDLICKFCGTKQNLPWKRLVFRTHVGNDWQLYCPVCRRKTWFTAQKKER